MNPSLFYRNVTQCPRTEPELSSAAAKAAQACGVHLAAIDFLPLPASPVGGGFPAAEMIGIGESDGKPEALTAVEGVPEAARSALKDLLKKQIQSLSLPKEEGELRRSAVESRHFPILGERPIREFVFAPIFVRFRGETKTKDGKSLHPAWASPVRLAGWLVLGCERELDIRQELLVLSVSQRLSELLEIVQLEETIQQSSRFLSIASHDLKTPLTAIYGILQLQERMIRQKKEEPLEDQLERQHSFLVMVIRQVERLNELIDGLLNLSRIQNGRFLVEPSEADVAVLLRDSVIPRMRVLADEAGVEIRLEAPANLTAWVDPVRFEEMATNLMMNGIRYSPEGGTLWVRLVEDGTAFRFSVRDQGPNVSLEDHERIFRPFEQAQRTARMGGMGLGLFISRQIAQLHGGNVTLVESIAGKGNVFEAYFPLRAVSALSA